MTIKNSIHNRKIIRTPFGFMELRATEKNSLSHCLWISEEESHKIFSSEYDANSDCDSDFTHVLILAQRQIEEYFSGKRMSFDLNLELQGTDFQISVWSALKKIPYGHKIFYNDLAKNIHKPGASMAIGTALNRNPLCLVLPCHRVISKNKNIIGYSGGAKIKVALHDFEENRAIKRE